MIHKFDDFAHCISIIVATYISWISLENLSFVYFVALGNQSESENKYNPRATSHNFAIVPLSPDLLMYEVWALTVGYD